MSPLLLWQYIGWAVFAIIVLGIILLVFGMYKDYASSKNAPSALPELHTTGEKAKNQFFAEDASELSEASPRASRRASRSKASAVNNQDAVPSKSSSFFDDDEGEEFSLTSGRD